MLDKTPLTQEETQLFLRRAQAHRRAVPDNDRRAEVAANLILSAAIVIYRTSHEEHDDSILEGCGDLYADAAVLRGLR